MPKWEFRVMASENEKCVPLAHEAAGTGWKLATLRKRSQLDFEIEFFERILSRDPNQIEVLMNLGELFTKKGCHRRALQVDLRLAQLRPRCATVMYNLACSHALLKHESDALAALRQAVALGYSDLDYLINDPDLSSLRAHPEFSRLIADLAAHPRTPYIL